MEEIAEIKVEGEVFLEVAFSPERDLLAATTGNPSGFTMGSGAVYLWDVSYAISDRRVEEAAVLTLPDEDFVEIAFNHNGTLLSTAGLESGNDSGPIRLWNIRSVLAAKGIGAPSTIVANRNRSGELNALLGKTLVFSPDGLWLVSGEEDGTIRMLTVNGDELIELACARSSTGKLTTEQWDRYIEDRDYRETCSDLPNVP